MLQQTRVEMMRPYFVRFMRKFPTPEAMAKASEDEVMQAWSGLGYYRRAANLHRAAKQLIRGWPEDLQSLPGVGPYTAGAVGSIAFGRRTAAVDGNVQRVIARWHALGALTPAVQRQIATLAQEHVDVARPGDWNQAMMELGATICTPAPKCEVCPVPCRVMGDVGNHGKKLPKKPPLIEERHFAYDELDGRIALVRAETGLLAGLYGLPEIKARSSKVIATHVFTHRIWHMHVHAEETGLPRFDPKEVPLSVAAKKAIQAQRNHMAAIQSEAAT